MIRSARVLAPVFLAAGFACAGVAYGTGVSRVGANPDTALAANPGSAGIHKIKHVIIIMQENRSFDTYFGTFPGADGLPRTKQGAFCFGALTEYHGSGGCAPGSCPEA